MPQDQFSQGAPCWADLWTSDVDGARRFYPALFGWEAGEAAPEFGGYFMFLLDGNPVCGAMGDMGDMPADDTWKIYLAPSDLDATLAAATAAGATVRSPAMPVADMGRQAVLADPSGATVGLWEAGTFAGFPDVEVPGTPSWFELHARDFDAAVDFYTAVFGWTLTTISDTEEFRYAVVDEPDGSQIAGILDASGILAGDVPAHWTTYWTTADADAGTRQVGAAGGSVIAAPENTPYGRISTVADPSGAQFRLRTPPAP